MPHFKTMYDKTLIGVWDLPPGKDIVLVIERVEAKVLENGKKKNKKPILYFRGKQKGMVCNVTNGTTIAAMYGTDTAGWLGKPIAVYGTTTQFGADTVECVRVRPGIPQQRPAAPRNGAGQHRDVPPEQARANLEQYHASAQLPPHDPETGELQDASDSAAELDAPESEQSDEEKMAAIDRGEM